MVAFLPSVLLRMAFDLHRLVALDQEVPEVLVVLVLAPLVEGQEWEVLAWAALDIHHGKAR